MFVVELTTVDAEVVFFAMIIIPDVVLLVDSVGVLTKLDELVLVEPEPAVELTIGSVVGALDVSLVRAVELVAV